MSRDCPVKTNYISKGEDVMERCSGADLVYSKVVMFMM
jgi:hypothetical protein